MQIRHEEENIAGRFNAPVFNEVAILIVGNEFVQRDIVLTKRDNQVRRICETHRSYDPLQYPILFCQGQDGYHFYIMQTNPTTGLPIQGKKFPLKIFMPSE